MTPRNLDRIKGSVRSLAAIALLAASPLQRSSTLANPAEPSLADLKSVDDLRSAFNRDAGEVRLVLLLSPT